MPEAVVVIGGNAAGMAAAGRAKRLNPGLDITVVEAGSFISYGICGVPHYVAGSVEDHNQLVHFTPAELEKTRGIKARTGVRVDEIVPARRILRCTELAHEEQFNIPYDKLVIATGYTPQTLTPEDTKLDGAFTVSRLECGILLRDHLQKSGSRTAVMVGGGYIGLSMVGALVTSGLQVTLLEKERQVLSQVDEDISDLILEELKRQGVEVRLQEPVRKVIGEGGVFRGVQVGREIIAADVGLIDIGIRPNTFLAEQAGITCGRSGAIEVDGQGLTMLPSVYAAGNCAETTHLVSGEPIFSALGTTAAKQGRIVGDNLAGHRSVFRGSLETSIVKVMDLSVARTGLTLRQALGCGLDADSVVVTSDDKAGYLAGSSKMVVKLVFQRRNGRLLGGQIAGKEPAAKRIDTLVAALTAGLDLEDLAQMDLAYAPPFGTLWDPIQIAANVALRK
jgi:NADPH-dependent 2,4-dienoyl-CoA reductase/sulfur reductase-like enzyme